MGLRGFTFIIQLLLHQLKSFKGEDEIREESLVIDFNFWRRASFPRMGFYESVLAVTYGKNCSRVKYKHTHLFLS
jgi:hypothetical protein